MATLCPPSRNGLLAKGALALTLTLCCSAASIGSRAMASEAESSPPDLLHVPSPDWRDQIIYFAMIDRFDDGDPSNNDQGQGEYSALDGRKFSGGDLVGLIRRLDYIEGLGATSLWITPPVANLWWNTRAQYGGYHGYWASDFKSVDAHFGTLDDYRALSSSLHGRGMYLIQDVVVNHMGDYFHYTDWREDDPTHGFRLQPDAGGNKAPAQPPFDRNDARDKRHRVDAIYHWTPHINNTGDRNQELNFQLADLDDLNTENPRVRRALRDSYGFWIREVGVDAFRVDTAFYVPPEYFADFVWSKDPKAPGMAHAAAQTGRNDFLLFGEGFAIDRAYEDVQMRKIDSYMRQPGSDDGRRFLPSMIQFPLYGTLGDVFARGHATTELADRIVRTLAVHEDPHRMPSFLDNHDVDRFLAAGSEAGLGQALLAIMTLPGIPTLYMGTEQGFRSQRASLFAGGHGSGGIDHFDTTHPLYRTIQQQAALRRSETALRRGTPTVVASQSSGPGLIAWRMDHEDESLLVAFNTADHTVLADHIEIGRAASLELRYSLQGDTPTLHHTSATSFGLQLPARSAYVWTLADPGDAAAAAAPERTDGPSLECDGGAQLQGRLAPGATALIVVDGALDRAARVHADAAGRWQSALDRSDWLRPGARHRVVVWDPQSAVASNACSFTADPTWTVRLHHRDPAGDDHGPDGRYRYPTDITWQDHRSLDIRAVTLRSYGTALQIDIEMAELVALWNPANGFDHLALTAYFSLPQAGPDEGSTILPLQHAAAPEGFAWQRRLRVGGWTNTLTSGDGASATHEGANEPVGAQLERLDDGRTLRLTVPPAALGRPASLDGLRVYLTSWDYDAGYRALATEPAGHTFGGGAADGPRIMDDTAVLELRL